MDFTGIRLIESITTDPVMNIALEEAIHIAVDKGAPPAIRFWRCEKAVVMGNPRKVADDVFIDNCRIDNIPVLRRHTGGGTVYIHPDVFNFTIAAPYMNPHLKPRSRIRESIYFLLKPLIDALKRAGCAVDIISNGDITLHGRKVGGNAQSRKKMTLLHHGTLMLDDRVDEMARYLRVPPERRGVPHVEFVTSFRREGHVFDEGAVKGDAITGWMQALGYEDVISGSPMPSEVETAKKLVVDKYSKEEHNLKR